MSASLAQAFVDFSRAAPTPYHCVASLAAALKAKGFQHRSEAESGGPETAYAPGQTFFVTRNGSALIAVRIGSKFKPGQGARIVAAHVDSPDLRLRPAGDARSLSEGGFQQLAIAPYGGGIWHTWFDRDLALAGRAVVRSGAAKDPSHAIKLFHIDQPICRIPTLAIHLDRSVNDAFKFDKEKHLQPIFSLPTSVDTSADPSNSKTPTTSPTIQQFLASHLLSLIHI